jgi:hypothetical protein
MRLAHLHYISDLDVYRHRHQAPQMITRRSALHYTRPWEVRRTVKEKRFTRESGKTGLHNRGFLRDNNRSTGRFSTIDRQV